MNRKAKPGHVNIKKVAQQTKTIKGNKKSVTRSFASRLPLPIYFLQHALAQIMLITHTWAKFAAKARTGGKSTIRCHLKNSMMAAEVGKFNFLSCLVTVAVVIVSICLTYDRLNMTKKKLQKDKS